MAIQDSSADVLVPGAGGSRIHHRPDIDGLRAVAVLAVVAFHAYPDLVPWGFVGVDVFFVISGFLITNILLGGLEENRFSFAHFYERRVRRIFPALFVVLAACYAASLVLGLPDETAALGRHAAAGGAFISNLLLWSESGYFDAAASTKPLLHLWSLGVEEQFYVAWPLILWAVRRRPRGIAIACFALPAASFLYGLWLVRDHHVAAFYSPFSRIWEILAGAALAWITRHRPAWLERGRDVRSAAALVLLALCAWFIDESRAFPGAWALLPVAAAWLWISAGAQAVVNARLLSQHAAVWVGLISYPLYLWHWPLLVFGKVAMRNHSWHPTYAVAASFVLAWLTYRTVEKPLRFGRHGRAKALGLGMAMTAMIAAGLVAVNRDGFPERFPPVVKALGTYSYDFDYRTLWRARACFLDDSQDARDFDRCPDRYDAPTLLLWGDSHAAQLYPGLARRFGSAYHVVQRTGSTCPPLFDAPIREQCRKIDERVRQEIARYHPQVVVVAARWGAPRYIDFDRVRHTVEVLKDLGVPHIIVAGPGPVWRGTLPHVLALRYQDDPLHRLPERVAGATTSEPFGAEAKLRELARQVGVEYVSLLDALCNAAGCLARTAGNGGDLVVWDDNHLTVAGSSFIAGYMPIPRTAGAGG